MSTSQDYSSAGSGAQWTGAGSSYLDLVARMVGRGEYFFPLAAAWGRDSSAAYRMTSNQALEDAHLDALSLYCEHNNESHRVRSAEPGEKGWDFEYQDVRLSYKTTKNAVQTIATIWDPDYWNNEWIGDRTSPQGVNTWWDFDYSVVFQTALHQKVSARINDRTVDLQGISGDPDQQLGRGAIIAIEWPNGSTAKVLDVIQVDGRKGTVREANRQLLRKRIRALADHVPANHIDLLQVAGPNPPPVDISLVGTQLNLEWSLRPAIYLFPKELMGQVPVRRGNKAWTVSATVVREQLIRQIAIPNNLYVPTPIWWGALVPPLLTGFVAFKNQDDSLVME